VYAGGGSSERQLTGLYSPRHDYSPPLRRTDGPRTGRTECIDPWASPGLAASKSRGYGFESASDSARVLPVGPLSRLTRTLAFRPSDGALASHAGALEGLVRRAGGRGYSPAPYDADAQTGLRVPQCDSLPRHHRG
jgi:hypothetical protein